MLSNKYSLCKPVYFFFAMFVYFSNKQHRDHRFELMISDTYSKLQVTMDSVSTHGNDD